jgi:hypothetical protein
MSFSLVESQRGVTFTMAQNIIKEDMVWSIIPQWEPEKISSYYGTL